MVFFSSKPSGTHITAELQTDEPGCVVEVDPRQTYKWLKRDDI